MERVTDWLKLWDQLTKLHAEIKKKRKDRRGSDPWQNRAHRFDESVKRRWKQPDSSRYFIKSVLKKNPGSTLLDIGAGTGSWSIYLSPYVKQITALDPSDAMIRVMKEKITENNIKNIKVIKGNWLESAVKPHDYVLASHSLYGIRDFSACVEKMNNTAKKSCFLVLRVPLINAPMAKAAMRVLGQPFDSANFQIAYNCLLQMGIYPDVMMEKGKDWHIWKNDSMDDALTDIRQRLGIAGEKHDVFLRKLLKDNLTEKDGKYVWPAGVRSALVCWDV